MSALLRFGLIGSGQQGRYLSEALAMTQRAELVACADPDEAAAHAGREWGYQRTYSDYAGLLAREDLDAVIVATTHDQLQPAALAAVQAGRHVFVEKPMALNARDGQALVDAARQADRRLMVGYTLRFMPERIAMKRHLEQGALGQIAHITGGQLIGKMGGWLGDKARGGGPLYYIGAHILDQVLWTAGRRVARVFAEMTAGADCQTAGAVEESALISLRFVGGITASVLTSQQLGGRYGWLDVMGTAGRMRVEWESHDLLIQSAQIAEYQHLTRVAYPKTALIPPCPANVRARISGTEYVLYWFAEFMEFCDAITEGRDPCVSGEDGVRVLEVIDAAFESAERGEAVTLAGE